MGKVPAFPSSPLCPPGGAIMSTRRRKGDRLPPFVPLFWQILNSKAYKQLPASAAKALPFFLGKVKCRHNDPHRYFEEFNFSYSEGQRLGFALATFAKVIRDLIFFGFVDPVDKGGLRGECKSYNVFRLSKRWENYGAEKFVAIKWECFFPGGGRSELHKRKETASKSERNKMGNGGLPSDFEVVGHENAG